MNGRPHPPSRPGLEQSREEWTTFPWKYLMVWVLHVPPPLYFTPSWLLPLWPDFQASQTRWITSSSWCTASALPVTYASGPSYSVVSLASSCMPIYTFLDVCSRLIAPNCDFPQWTTSGVPRCLSSPRTTNKLSTKAKWGKWNSSLSTGTALCTGTPLV